MTRPNRFLLRMVLFLLIVTAVGGALYAPIARAFMANPALNGVIFAVALLGIAYIIRQVLILNTEIDWLDAYKRSQLSSTVQLDEPPPRLVTIEKMLRNRGPRGQVSTQAARSMLDSVLSRLDEARDMSRYLIGLLIFLGLLGTFWGLLQTVGSVGETIKNLDIGASGDYTKLFDNLKRGLESPLTGMGTAFASSLFGLSGSLVLGFLDLQAGQAQNRFYNELEEWLSGLTRISGGTLNSDGDQSVPAYVQALLEQTADGLENLQRVMVRSEENRSGSNSALLQLNDRLSTLADTMRAEQDLLVKLVEHTMELRPVLTRLAADRDAGGIDQTSRTHLRNIDVHLARLVEDSATGRTHMVDELRSEIKMLARTIAASSPRGNG